MKSIILLALLLQVSFCANSQTVTTDSTVVVPLRYLRKAVADLRRFDDAKQEINLLKPRIVARDKTIDLLQRDTAAKAEYIEILSTRLQGEKLLSATIETNCNLQLATFQKEAKVQHRKTVFQKVLIGIAAGATGYFIHSLIQ